MKNEVKNSETVTITKAEYDSLKQIESEFNWLKEQLQIIKKKTFGSSSERTEQLNDGISLLFNEAEIIEDIESKTEEITVEKHTRRKKTGCIEKLPENVETYVVEHDLSEEEKKCPECGEEMEVIGRKVTKHLEMIPAKVVIREDVYYTYACKKCHENEADTPVVETPQPNPVIKGSFASAEAVAHLMTQKFVMHSPLYRQEQELKQKGIELSRQTMSNWFITASNLWLEPLYDRLKERHEQSKPLLDAFFAWAKTLGSIAPKSKIGKAVYYLNEEEPYLRRYIEDGRLDIDNNRAERSIKPFVIGRKNWLFVNTPSDAKASATIFSIIETAKENGLEPYAYLRYVFIKAPNLREDESIDILLPWNAPDCCRGKLSVTSDK